MLTLGKTLTPEQRLTKGIIDITGREQYIALAGVLMIGERAVRPCPPHHTACTNGRDEYYDPQLIEKVNDAELRYVLLHENYHKLYRHLGIYKYLFDIDPEVANIACDNVINLKINDENTDGFATMPTGDLEGHAEERFRGMPLVKVFNILLKEKKEGKQGQNNSGKQGEGQSAGSGGKPGTGFDDHDWAGANALSEEEKHELERNIDEAVRQGALAAGNTLADIKELLKPQINWRDVLREFVTTTCAGRDFSTYRRPNRRYMSMDIYMPSSQSEQVGELIYAIDMSGSTSMGQMRPAFITEGQSVCDMVTPEKLRVLYWDTEIAREEVYTTDVKDFAKVTKPTGGGGTVVTCVEEHINKNKLNPQALVVFTDGDIYGGWGSFNCPVLWVIVDGPSIVPPYGKVVHVDSTMG